MKKAWKKVFSLVLSLSMVLALVPVTAMAEDDGQESEPLIVNDGGENGNGKNAGVENAETSETEEDKTEDADDEDEASVIHISDAAGLIAAIKGQKDDQTWILADGTYDIGNALVEEEFTINKETGFVFPITADNLKITAAEDADVIITSSFDPGKDMGGVWHYQNFITISGEGVTIENVKLQGNKNSYYDGCNKVIELIDGAKNFTLSNVELLPLKDSEGKVNSGSIYVNVEEAGTVTLEDVTMYSWINAREVKSGNVIADGLVQDFTDNVYAGYSHETYGYAWNPGISGNDENVTIKDFTIKVDDSTKIDEQIFNDNLKAGTTIALEEGTYKVSKCIVITKDVVIEGNDSTIQMDTDVSSQQSGRCNVFELENGAEIEINDLTIDGSNGADGSNAKHGVNIFTAPSDEGQTTVTLNNVTIQNCEGYGVVSNASNLTVEDITTSNNVWGGINVDNSSTSKEGGSTFTMVSGELNEDNSLCIENAAKQPIEATIEDGTMKNVVLQNVDANTGVSLAIENGNIGNIKEQTKSGEEVTKKEATKGIITVTGGTFGATVPTEYLPEGSKAVEEDGKFVVKEKEPSVLTTDIESQTFKVGVPTVFTFSTIANDYEGTMVVGTSDFSDADAIEKIEYWETNPAYGEGWHDLPGNSFGPSSGFPMADATSTFRVTFKTAGNYTFTASMKEVDTDNVLCSTEVTFTVSQNALTLTADKTSMRGSGTITLTLGGLLDEDTATVACDDSSIVVKDLGDGKYSAYLPNRTQDYTFTATADNADKYDDATVEVSVTRKSSSSSSSSSSAKTYAVSAADDMENGKVTVSPSKAEKGDKVTITVTPDKGYEINKVTAKDADGNKIDLKDNGNGKYTFTMPASKVEVKATFNQTEETPAVVEEVKPIILTINQKIANIFGELMVTDVAPMIRNERTMLPIRLIAENLGATVAWDSVQNKVTITKGELTIEIFIGQPFALVNGTPVDLDAPAFIENDRTYLPLRFVAENLGASVTWNGETQEVTILPAK